VSQSTRAEPHRAAGVPRGAPCTGASGFAKHDGVSEELPTTIPLPELPELPEHGPLDPEGLREFGNEIPIGGLVDLSPLERDNGDDRELGGLMEIEEPEEASMLDDAGSASLSAFMDPVLAENIAVDDGHEGFEADEEALRDLDPLDGDPDGEEGPNEIVVLPDEPRMHEAHP
jgi:hypothetical protein